MTASFRRGPGKSFVDLERGVFYRLAEGKRATNKRQPPVPIPPRLLAHMRRWTRLGNLKEYFVEWNGTPVQSIKVGFKRAISLSGMPGKVTPHTLRHTAVHWSSRRTDTITLCTCAVQRRHLGAAKEQRNHWSFHWPKRARRRQKSRKIDRSSISASVSLVRS